MAGATISDLNGMYKEVYGELQKAVPEAGILQRLVPWSRSERIGDSFHEPVILTNEHGYSYGGTAGDAFTLEDPVTMASKDAVIGAYHYCMTSSISLPAASRAMSAGKAAFANVVTVLSQNAAESAGKRLEISLHYGLSGIGDVPDVGATVEVTSTTADLVFSAATWAPGIWCGAEGAKVNFYDLDNDALISSGADSIFVVTQVTNSTRTVKFTGTATGIDALDVAAQAGGVRCYFNGSKTNDMAGLQTIFSNTGSLFGIDAAAYGMWKGNTFDAAGEISMAKLETYVGNLVGRGLNEDVTVELNPLAWVSLNNEYSAGRMVDSSYKSRKGENGVAEIEFYGQNGTISVVSNPIVKGGHAFIFPKGRLNRVGSAENDNNLPTQDKNPFYPLASQAGFGFRYFSDQAIYSRKPASCAFVSGITLPS